MTKRLEADGSRPAERMSPDELKAAMRKEHAELAQQVKELNIELE